MTESGQTATIRPRAARQIRAKSPWIPLTATFGYAVIFLIYAPIVWLILMSFSERALTGKPWPLSGLWYVKLFEDTRWVEPIQLSVIIGLVVGLLCMLAATLVGRALPRLRRRGVSLSIFLLPLFLPSAVLGVTLFMYYRTFIGFKTGYWSLILGHFVWAFPFALLGMLIVAVRFDNRLSEAAEDLGASQWQRFWHIEFPIMKPGIITAGFFGFLLSFNELERSVFLWGGRTTLPLFTWSQASSHSSNVPLIYSLSTITTIVSLVLMVVVLRMLFAVPNR